MHAVVERKVPELSGESGAATAIAPGVVSITSTRRRRFLWCAWLGGAPTREAFRPPDRWTTGGAQSPDAARIEAEIECGVALRVIEPQWARAWMRVQRDEPAFYPLRTSSDPRAVRPMGPHEEALATLGVDATVTAEGLRRAFQHRALETHPDGGGRDEDFRAVMAAWNRLRKVKR